MQSFLPLLFLTNLVFANEKIIIPEGKIISPYHACKDVFITTKDNYLKHKFEWENIEKACHTKVQIALDAGVSSLDPLNEGAQFLEFSHRVANKVLINLDKSKQYADCSTTCFKGAKSCVHENQKAIDCNDRKKEIQNALKVFSRKARMELALSTDAPGLLNVNIRNVLSVDKDRMINTNLRDFEVGTPNPVGKIELSDRELTEAKRRQTEDRKSLEAEYKAKGFKNYSDWMSVQLMKKFDDHKEKYRQIIFQEAPILAVIDRPHKMNKGDDPVWTDEQLASAFSKLSKNANDTKDKIHWSLKNSKLEFTRLNGEALGKWLTSLAPGKQEQHDLLYYIEMKNQVEEVLKEDQASCGIATSLDARFHSKEMQNAGISIAASVLSAGVAKGATSLSASIFRIGRALTGAEAAGLTGIAIGSTTLGDSFHQYNATITEATTKSGAGGNKEGTSLRTSAEIDNKRFGVETSLMFAPVDAIGGWSVGKTLYNKLAKQMAKERPDLINLIEKAKLDNVSRDQAVDLWLAGKVDEAIRSYALTIPEKLALQNKNSRKIIENLVKDIEKSSPNFFKNPKNLNFFLKTAAKISKKEIGDPKDLGEKAKFLLLKLNTNSINDSWDLASEKGLLKVFDNAITELRISSHNNPAIYAKFTTDKNAQEQIIINALKRSGVHDNELNSMVQCMTP